MVAAPTALGRGLWFAAGWICFSVGVVGVALPGIPTTGPMILALACFARSSPRFHRWLYEHPRFGPPLKRWREHRVIPTRAKAGAFGTMGASLTYLVVFSPIGPMAIAGVAALMAVGVVVIARCPSRPPGPLAD